MESEPVIRTIQDHISVSASVIADISSGIYRSPANALKELVSNSFDADATKIIMTSGYPNFEVMTAVDDGEGMIAEDFGKYMRSIGGSYKREAGRQLTQVRSWPRDCGTH